MKRVKILANVTVELDKEGNETGIEWVNFYELTGRNQGKILKKVKKNDYTYLQDEERIYSGILLPNENYSNLDDFTKYNIFSPEILKIGDKNYVIDLSGWN